jgi:hypothetical protein
MMILAMHGSQPFMSRWREEGGVCCGRPRRRASEVPCSHRSWRRILMRRQCIDFAMDGLCYQLNSSLEAML